MATQDTAVKRAIEGLNSHPLRPHVRPVIHRAIFRYRLLTAPLRLLPDFIIIGAARAGTTSLFNYLAEHPYVAPAIRKEVHFFDDNFEKGASWYRAHFPSIASREPKRLTGRRLVAAESTPYYLFHPLAPERAARTVPGAKLIVLLRNPIDRAQSQYQHEVRVGVFAEVTFEQAMERELEMLANGAGKIYRHYNALSKGIYVDQLQLWMNAFPTDQMLILRAEDLYDDPRRVLRGAQDFLELPPHEPRRFHEFHKSHYTQIHGDTRRRLVEYFRPHNQRLYELLGADFGWDR